MMHERTQNPYERLLKALWSLGAVASAAEALLRNFPSRVRLVGAHQGVVQEGVATPDCCLILEGFYWRHKTVAGGQRQILSFHLPGDIPDLITLHGSAMDYP